MSSNDVLPAYCSIPCNDFLRVLHGVSASPYFRRVVGLEGSRHPGLPSGVAKVTRPSTESQSCMIMVPKHLGVPKKEGCPKCAEVKRLQCGY
jgi:hypothetical protein